MGPPEGQVESETNKRISLSGITFEKMGDKQ